jgi:hypothetical protein
MSVKLQHVHAAARFRMQLTLAPPWSDQMKGGGHGRVQSDVTGHGQRVTGTMEYGRAGQVVGTTSAAPLSVCQ